MSLKLYILVNKKPVVENDYIKWGKWFQNERTHIGDDTINNVRISTIFFGIDHSYSGGEPLLFETMIFGGEYDLEQERYSTYKQAEAGHKKWVKKILNETSLLNHNP